MAKLSDFNEKLISADYRTGYNDCIKKLSAFVSRTEDELRDLADESYKKFRNGAGTYYDGVSDTCWTAVGKLHELVDEVKKYEQI